MISVGSKMAEADYCPLTLTHFGITQCHEFVIKFEGARTPVMINNY